jgi:hypothetical protein
VFVCGEYPGMGKFVVDGGPEGRRVRVCPACQFQWNRNKTFRRKNRNLRDLAQLEAKKLRALLDVGMSHVQIARALEIEPWAVASLINRLKLTRKASV